jgi:hypothetical protein
MLTSSARVRISWVNLASDMLCGIIFTLQNHSQSEAFLKSKTKQVSKFQHHLEIFQHRAEYGMNDGNCMLGHGENI